VRKREKVGGRLGERRNDGKFSGRKIAIKGALRLSGTFLYKTTSISKEVHSQTFTGPRARLNWPPEAADSVTVGNGGEEKLVRLEIVGLKKK